MMLGNEEFCQSANTDRFAAARPERGRADYNRHARRDGETNFFI
jgi:hypothetical protein